MTRVQRAPKRAGVTALVSVAPPATEAVLGVVKVKVGPITAQYKGAAHFASRDDESHRAVIVGTAAVAGRSFALVAIAIVTTIAVLLVIIWLLASNRQPDPATEAQLAQAQADAQIAALADQARRVERTTPPEVERAGRRGGD